MEQNDQLMLKVQAKIQTSLEKGNVTDAVILKFKTEYDKLIIAGPGDRLGYNVVHDARMTIKNTRILAEKICESGKAPYFDIVKAWNDKKKDLVDRFKEIENPLQEKEDKYLAAVEEERQRKEKERIQGRVNQITPYVNSIDMKLISEMSTDQFIAYVAQAKEAFETNQKQQEEQLLQVQAILDQSIISTATTQPKQDNGEVKVTPVASADPKFNPTTILAEGMNTDDKTALLNLAKSLDEFPFPLLDTEKGKVILSKTKELLLKISLFIRKKIDE